MSQYTMSSHNKRVKDKKEGSDVLSQIGEDSGAVIDSNQKRNNDDKMISGENDPTRSDE
jgi:hypothetical protein